jgi:hypothetical protein
MRSALIALIVAASPLATHSQPVPVTTEPSLREITSAGADPYTPIDRPASLAEKIIRALEHPDGDRPCCGGSSGLDYVQAHRSVEATSPAAELLADYAAQLVHAGWTSSLTHHDGAVALQTWHFSSVAGQQWHALLLIEESAEHPADRRQLTLRLTRIPAPQR